MEWHLGKNLARRNQGRYRKITDQVVYLGYTISKSAVKTVLIENGYDPEPDLTERSTWQEFLRSHWEVLAACDFFTIELLVKRKLVRRTVFFVMELVTRKVFFAPVKLQPDGAYMKQVVRSLTDMEEGLLNGKRYLIHDRDPIPTPTLKPCKGDRTVLFSYLISGIPVFPCALFTPLSEAKSRLGISGFAPCSPYWRRPFLSCPLEEAQASRL